MRKLSLCVAVSAALCAAAPLANAEPASGGKLIFGLEPVGAPPPVQDVQFLFGGRNYCWYAGGWHGAGYYWCGYANRRGLGWGGPVGWHGWRGGAPVGHNAVGSHAAIGHAAPVGAHAAPQGGGHPGGGDHGGERP